MKSFRSFMDYAVAAVEHNARQFARQRKEAAMMDPQLDGEEAVRQLAIKPPQKFCADCQWVDKSTGPEAYAMWKCVSPGVRSRFDLVSGKPYPNFCSTVRISDDCGPAGRLWQAQITEKE